MTPEGANEMLADAWAARTDAAEIRRAELTLKRDSLITRLETLLRSLESRRIEIASLHDNDTTPAKHAEHEHRDKIAMLLGELGKEYTDKKTDLRQVAEELQEVEARVRGLETLLPNASENN